MNSLTNPSDKLLKLEESGMKDKMSDPSNVRGHILFSVFDFKSIICQVKALAIAILLTIVLFSPSPLLNFCKIHSQSVPFFSGNPVVNLKYCKIHSWQATKLLVSVVVSLDSIYILDSDSDTMADFSN